MLSLAAVGGAFQLASLVREAVNRLLSLPDAVATFAGFHPEKKLRLRVVVLRDGDGNPVATEEDLAEALTEARRVLEREARTRIVPAGDRLVETLEERAPAAALESPCSTQGLWRADLGVAGRYFRARIARNPLFVGRGAPITVFVVRDVIGKCGCSLGPLGDYVTIDHGGLKGSTRRILVHELAHSCGLPHSKRDDNLMRARAPGERLERWQEAVLRSSRHVTYL